jgi:tungstate transport system permease protein
MSLPLALASETVGIIGVTLRMSVASTAVSSVLGITLGLLLERARFPGKKAVVRLCRTLMGTPPVVAGLVAYLLLMRRGPLGFLGAIFTVQGMVFAQVLIITPIVCGMVYSYACRSAPHIRAFAMTMGANAWQTRLLMLKEMKSEIYFVVLAGFSRSISEVGAVMIVGGNIENKTRTMTTAISLMRNMGNYTEAITLGVVLLILAFLIQSLSDILHKDRQGEENI